MNLCSLYCCKGAESKHMITTWELHSQFGSEANWSHSWCDPTCGIAHSAFRAVLSLFSKCVTFVCLIIVCTRHYSFCEYEKMANKFFTRKFNSSAMLPYKFLEAEFWKEITSGRSCNIEYGCDIEGSAFSNSSMDPLGTSKWNLKVRIWISHQIPSGCV